MTMAQKMLIWGCVLIMIGMGVTGCSVFSVKPDAEVLEARVGGMMDARVNNEWATAYKFYDPAYKATKSKDDFVHTKRKSQTIRYEIESIEMAASGDEATVTVKYTAKVMGIEFEGIVNRQTWIKSGGTWYLQVTEDSAKKLFQPLD